jgi:hypothetical protein
MRTAHVPASTLVLCLVGAVMYVDGVRAQCDEVQDRDLICEGGLSLSRNLRASSSVLQPSALPPKPGKQPTPCTNEHDTWFGALRRYAEATCTYGPAKASDDSLATAWCEGAAGAGVGEAVLVDLETPSAAPQMLRIAAGFQKSHALWQANNRPTRIRVDVLQVMQLGCAVGDFCGYGDVQLLSTSVLDVPDAMGASVLPLPKATPEVLKARASALGVTAGTFAAKAARVLLRVEIVSAAKGRRYDDTCISELGLQAG